MKKVYYVGDWAVLTGPVFAETPFHHSPKGLEIFNYGVWLKDALEKEAEARAPEDKKEGPGERQHECRAGDAQVEESNEPFEREEWRGDGWTGSGER